MYSVLLLAAMATGDAAPAGHPKAYVHSYGSCYGGCYGIGYTGWVGVGGWGHPHASTAGWGLPYGSDVGWGLPYGSDVGWGAAYGGYAPAYGGHGGHGGSDHAGCAYRGGATGAPAAGTVILPPGMETARKADPEANGDGSARLVVQLPEGAKLYVDNSKFEGPGTSRTFRTPALEKGQVYYYELRAEVEKDGQVVSQKRRVVLTAGKTASADFSGLGSAPGVATAKAK